MKIFILIICCFLAAESTEAQNNKIDSLNRLIGKTTTDTERIQLTLKKINVLGNINLDSAIALAKQTLEAAQKINYYRGEIDLRQNLVSNYCFKGEYGPAEENLKFLEHFIKTSKDSSDFASVYGNRGMMYGMQSKYDSSIYWYEKAIGISERSDKKQSLGAYYSNIAIAYQQQSNFVQALFYQQKALLISEKNKNEVQVAYTLMNMGNTYDNMEDFTRAEQSYLNAIKLAKKETLTNVELYGYSNLASLYIKQNKWKQVYEFAMKAAALGGSMGDQGIQAASMSKAATALAYANKPVKAEALAKKAIALADSSRQPLNIYQAYSSMGTILRLKGSYAAAIPYFQKGFESMKGSDMYTVDNGEVYNELSACYEKIGNYSKALENYKIATQMTDSARSKHNIQKATELNMNYEFEKKQEAQKTQQIAKDEVAGARQLALIVGLGLTLVLAVGAFVGFKNKQKANALLKNQKQEIENTLVLLKATQTQLIQSEKMASLGELTAGIAHEIQNPLNFVNNFSEVNTELLDEMNREIVAENIAGIRNIAADLERNMEKITNHGKRADAIVKGMLQHTRISHGHMEPRDISALADEYLKLSYQGFRAKDISFHATLETDFDQSIEKTNIVPQDIGRVLLNLYNNAFYAVSEKKKLHPNGYEPIVSVTTKKMDGKVEIRVKDNGNGIQKKVLDKIFQPFFTTKPAGQGTGLGLSMNYDIIKAHRGEINVETKEGEFAEFIIHLPT
ncbi:MAG TPA: tetratricopeptide repeat protein [Puia sp.]|nr:tetratricopeptide repeat protein [Puia sp.]